VSGVIGSFGGHDDDLTACRYTSTNPNFSWHSHLLQDGLGFKAELVFVGWRVVQKYFGTYPPASIKKLAPRVSQPRMQYARQNVSIYGFNVLRSFRISARVFG
jgi:hypothetical protein